jgi:hypothetical protein
MLYSSQGTITFPLDAGNTLLINNISGVETVSGSIASREDVSAVFGTGRVGYGPQTSAVTITLSTTGQCDYEIRVGDVSPSRDTVRIDPITGGLDTASMAALGASGILAPIKTYPPLGQFKFASFGDSITDLAWSTAEVQSLTASSALTDQKPTLWVIEGSRGLLRVVFDGGIGGQRTDQFLSRSANAYSTTRAAIEDMQRAGVRACWISGGINDVMQNITAAQGNTGAAAIESRAQTIFASLQTTMLRCVAMGVYPVWADMMGLTWGTGIQSANAQAVSSDVPYMVTCLRRVNALMAAAIPAAKGTLGGYAATNALVTNSDGTWKTNYDAGDGLHPGPMASSIVGPVISASVLSGLGQQTCEYSFPSAPNLFSNQLFQQATTGLATGVAVATVGTVTGTSQQIIDAADPATGQMKTWQEYKFTATAFDGNGEAGAFFSFTCPLTVAGGGPVDVGTLDRLAGEIDVWIDDGAGGAPALAQRLFRCRVSNNASGSAFSDFPQNNTGLTYPLPAFTGPFVDHMSTQVIQNPGGTYTTYGIFLGIYTKSASTLRIRFANPRMAYLGPSY